MNSEPPIQVMSEIIPPQGEIMLLPHPYADTPLNMRVYRVTASDIYTALVSKVGRWRLIARTVKFVAWDIDTGKRVYHVQDFDVTNRNEFMFWFASRFDKPEYVVTYYAVRL